MFSGFEFVTPDFGRIVNFAIWIVILMGVDLLGGVLVALIKKEFKWEKLPGILNKYALYIVGWLLAEFLGVIPESIGMEAGLAVDVLPLLGSLAFYGIVIFAVGSIGRHIANTGVLPDVFERIGIIVQK